MLVVWSLIPVVSTFCSHTFFQTPHSLSFFLYHTGNFCPETNLGAMDSGHGFRAMLGVAHFLSWSCSPPGSGSDVHRWITPDEQTMPDMLGGDH